MVSITTEGDSFLENEDKLERSCCRCSSAESRRTDEPPGVMSILCLVALKRRLWLLPILTSGWLFSSFWTSYAIAVSYNHTEADFPYISHTAIEAPERCVFGQMVNIGAVMLGMNVILRYLFVKKFLLCKGTAGTDRWFRVNLAGLCLGIASAFGLSMVANFQTQVQRVPHYIGAFFAFGFGTVYCWVQSALTYKVHYTFKGKRVLAALQFTNSIVMTLLLVLFGTSKAVYKVREYRGQGTKWDTLRAVYLTSTITEWLLALSVLTFTLTFAPDFRNMRVDDPKIFLEETYERKHSSLDLKDLNSNKNGVTVIADAKISNDDLKNGDVVQVDGVDNMSVWLENVPGEMYSRGLLERSRERSSERLSRSNRSMDVILLLSKNSERKFVNALMALGTRCRAFPDRLTCVSGEPAGIMSDSITRMLLPLTSKNPREVKLDSTSGKWRMLFRWQTAAGIRSRRDRVISSHVIVPSTPSKELSGKLDFCQPSIEHLSGCKVRGSVYAQIGTADLFRRAAARRGNKAQGVMANGGPDDCTGTAGTEAGFVSHLGLGRSSKAGDLPVSHRNLVNVATEVISGPPSDASSSGIPNVTKVRLRQSTRPLTPPEAFSTIGQFEYWSTTTKFLQVSEPVVWNVFQCPITKQLQQWLVVNNYDQFITSKDEEMALSRAPPTSRASPSIGNYSGRQRTIMSVPMLPIASEGDRFLENEEGIERYAIAVSYNHTEAFFPTISHTAIEAPERCVFAQMVNIGAVLLGMTVILRYLFVKTFLLCRGTAGTDRSFCSNLAGLYLGIVSAFGLTIAANFQTKVQFVPHNIGAFSAFGFGTIYCWVQSAITYRCRCTFTGKRVLAALQFTNCIVMTLLFVIFIISRVMFKRQENNGHGTKWDTLRAVYLTSTITEWLLALSVLTFMFTFAPDFRKMRVDGPKIFLEK
ncbi:uncharacterized protein LOC128231061 [Mya arenaria]|uniref:uncharacterized protein LOC128231061 n=1 Tax=Mya arenaria TaxID=6604 RepID=UPI0022E10A1C|nr:uncharacterized protein LOC128231061 [Mya arenaria]